MNNHKILLNIFAVFLLTACETVIDVDLPEEPARLVVNAFVNPDSIVRVRISQSKSPLDRSPFFTLVDDAQATLFENGQEITQLSGQGEGLYIADYRPVANRQYTLQVSAEGLATVEANSTIVPAVDIQEITIDSVQRESGTSCTNGDCQPIYSNEYRVQLRLSDPENQTNFYEILGYVVSEDSMPQYDNLGNFIGYESEIRRYRANFTTDDPIVNNPAPGFGDDSFYGRSLLFTDEIFAGRGYTLDFTTDNYYRGEAMKLTIELRTLSEDQYQYLRTWQLQDYNEGDPFSEVVPVYSNVENGFGIFAGYSADSVVFEVLE